MKAEKYIENIRSRTSKMIEDLRNEANDAYLNWADTGYQRYMTKNERLLAEADKLELFIHPQEEISRAHKQTRIERERKEALKRLLDSVKNTVECDMRYDFPDCTATRRLEAIVQEYKSIRDR